jgi:hypothetical protein
MNVVRHQYIRADRDGVFSGITKAEEAKGLVDLNASKDSLSFVGVECDEIKGAQARVELP